MDDIAVRLEHVYFLNRLDRLNIQFLEGCLQLLVVQPCALMHLFGLSSWCALSTIRTCQQLSRNRANPPFLMAQVLFAYYALGNRF